MLATIVCSLSVTNCDCVPTRRQQRGGSCRFASTVIRKIPNGLLSVMGASCAWSAVENIAALESISVSSGASCCGTQVHHRSSAHVRLLLLNIFNVSKLRSSSNGVWLLLKDGRDLLSVCRWNFEFHCSRCLATGVLACSGPDYMLFIMVNTHWSECYTGRMSPTFSGYLVLHRIYDLNKNDKSSFSITHFPSFRSHLFLTGRFLVDFGSMSLRTDPSRACISKRKARDNAW